MPLAAGIEAGGLSTKPRAKFLSALDRAVQFFRAG